MSESACRDFCFEGTCELCQVEVTGGAKELGSKAQPGQYRSEWQLLCGGHCRHMTVLHLAPHTSVFSDLLLRCRYSRIGPQLHHSCAA